MYLKSIEIQGFKSFPDKTLINLGRGITAIVGPNGSGKSNIVDAIRWVCGEQSAKTLRGGKMEDVIFGGTLKRSPQGFCQVALTIDNHDGGLTLEYDEIEVTRRYYRSGESEFFINKKAVRLKDVHELFMDTGIGRDGYSVIGQGRIDEILSVKSVDRREIFEEASGISKFRYRKEESERKLTSTEENLMRVRDIITELEGQVEPLRVQAEKAKAFLVYRDELRVLEVSVWLDSLEKLKDNLAKARSDFENAERMLSAKQEELDLLYKKSEELSVELREREIHEEELRTELRAAEDARAATDGEKAVKETTLKNNEENILARLSEITEQTGRGDELSAKRAELEEKIKAGEKQEAEINEKLLKIAEKIEKIRAESQSVSEKFDAISAKIQLDTQKKSDAQAKLDSLSALSAEISSGTDKSGEELQGLSEKLKTEREKAEKNAKAIEENEEKKQSALNMIKGFELRLKARENKVAEGDAQIAQKERELGAKQDRKRILESLEREYEGFSLAVKKVMQASERRELSGIHAPVSQIISTDDKYAVAIEIALGGAMQWIVTDTEEDAKQAINYLKRVGGRATMRPLSNVKTRNRPSADISHETGVFGYADTLVSRNKIYDKMIEYLLGNVVVCTDINCAISVSRKYGYSFKIVTLDGQLVDPSGTMTGGSVSKNTGILSRANELNRLASEITELENTLKTEKAALAEAKRELEASRYESNVAQDELRAAEDELLRLYTERDQHSILLSELSLRESELKNANRGAEERLAEIEKQSKELKATASELEKRIEEEEKQRTELSELMEKSGELSSGLSEESAGLRESAAAISAERDATKLSIEQLDTVLSQMSGDRKSKEEMIALIRAQNEALSAEIAALAEKRAEQDKQAQDKKALIDASAKDRLRIEGERNRAQKLAQDCNNELLGLERERARLENKKTQTENEENVILDKMWENYELTRTSAAEIRVELESLSGANKRIGELKSSIKKLGDVNVGSIEEYAKVNERYTFLTEQRNDLEKAKVDLLKVIDDLTRNMKTIFSEQFKLINEEFGRTFVEIFGGGSAVLILEDENDILNCGIEIKVEMPGKSMRAISLLSGGEKAFVAIALYFAVIKVRPTPFCVLDEIEAALDDVNVARYAYYMRRLCDKTQFIVITHRRGTMEGSDVLYGVTMPEQGVTKLLAININDVEEKIKVKPN